MRVNTFFMRFVVISHVLEQLCMCVANKIISAAAGFEPGTPDDDAVQMSYLGNWRQENTTPDPVNIAPTMVHR